MVENQMKKKANMLEVLHVPNFALLQTSRLFFFCARTMDITVLSWLVLELTNSAFLLALIGVFRMIPALVLGAISGVFADRFDKRKILIVTQGIGMILTLILWSIIAFQLVQFWHVALISLALGIMNAFDWPARMALISELLGKDRTFDGVAIDNLNGYLMMLAGPTIGGWIISSLGFSYCYAVISVLYSAGTLTVFRMSMDKKVANGAKNSTAKDIVSGFVYALNKPVIRSVLAVTVVMNLFCFTYAQLIPIFARDVLMTGSEGYGLLVGITGLGAAIAAILVAFTGGVENVEFVFAVATLSTAITVVGFSLSHWYALSLVLRLFAGVFQTYFEIGQYGLPLAYSSEEMRGRVMSILNLAMEGMIPIGVLEIGFLADSIGAGYSTLLNGSIALVISMILIMLMPVLRKKDKPQEL